MKTQSFRFHGGVVRIAAWHGRADVASLALRGRGTLAPASRGSAARTRSAPPATARWSRMPSRPRPPCRSSTPGSRCAAGSASSSTTSRQLPAETGRTRRARRRERDVLLGDRPGRVRRVLGLRPRRAARRPRARRRARTSGSPASTRARSATRCSAGRTPTATCSASRSTRTSQGRGVGAALLTDGLQWLRERGATRAYVNTQSDNDRAYALYRARRVHADARRALCPRTHAVTRARRALAVRARVAHRRGRGAGDESRDRRAPPSPSSRCSAAARVDTPCTATSRCGSTSRPRCSPQDQDVQLRLRMHQPVTTTTAFDRTIEGDRLGNRIDTKTVPVERTAPRRAGRRAAHLRPAGFRHANRTSTRRCRPASTRSSSRCAPTRRSRRS